MIEFAAWKVKKLLNRLAKHACGDLLSLSKQVVVGESKILIPGVTEPVSVRLVANRNMKYHGFFLPGKICVYSEGRSKNETLSTLVHEMRHAQQFAFLGEKTFYKDCSSMFCTAVEIDAVAVQLALKCSNPYNELKRIATPDIRRVIKTIEQICRTHSRELQIEL